MARLTKLGMVALLLTMGLVLFGCGSANDPDIPGSNGAYIVLDNLITRGSPQDIDIDGNRLFIAEYHAGVGVYDISSTSSVSLLEQLDTPQRCQVVNVESDLNALVVNTSSQTYIYYLDSLKYNDNSILGDAGVRDIATSVYIDSIRFDGEAWQDTVVRIIKADGNDGVQVSTVFKYETDFSNGNYFQKDDAKTLAWPTFTSPSGVAPIDSIDFLAVGLLDVGVGFCDVSQATSQTAGFWLSDVDTPGEATKLVYLDGYVYVADGIGGVAIIDASDINNPVYVTSWKTDGLDHVEGIAVYEHQLVLLDQYDGVFFLNVSNPARPVYVADYKVREPTAAMFDTEDGILYVTSLEEGLTVFKLTY